MAVKEKYINLFTDFGFKRVFGEEGNKDILMDFLNQVLPQAYNIEELHFSKNQESLKYLRDLHNVVDTAFKEGEQKGLGKGKQLGLKEGLEKGKQLGLEEGKYKKNVIAIHNMTLKKLQAVVIAEFLSLTEAYVRQIQKELEKEAAIVTALAKKQTTKQIAQEMNVSEWFVEVIYELQKK